jgi:hypothetical protein
MYRHATQSGLRADDDRDASVPSVGRRTLTSKIVVQRQPAAEAQVGDIYRGADEQVLIAHAGVRDAAEPLPHAGAIQASFGRFDIGGVRVATGGAARDASAAIGAEAYATGDRIAFAGAPDLHLAAHEAAHVVQQRAGVQLSGGVGAAGDRYERHADQVADRVVRGESAEALLAEMAGGGAGGTAIQKFDSRTHVGIGDSVEGEPVVINTVEFSPGELAALVDYVGDLANARTYAPAVLVQMRTLLQNGIEDVATWDALTNGQYSKECLENGKHVAPSEGGGAGADVERAVLALYGAALAGAADAHGKGLDTAEGKRAMDDARLQLYTSEHYLEDAFSAGHQVAAADVEAAVDAVVSNDAEWAAMIPIIAHEVFVRASDEIANYALLGMPITSEAVFIGLATGGGLFQGPDAFDSGIRRYIHERLDQTGVEVSSPAHPAPWTLTGDHDLESPDAQVSVHALQAALADAREVFEVTGSLPAANPQVLAQQLFTKHRPVPTGDARAAIDEILELATVSNMAFMTAMADSMAGAICETMDYLVGKGALTRIVDPEKPLAPPPEIPPPEDDGEVHAYGPTRE